MLVIDHIYPACQFGLAVAVADVQVTGKDHFDMLLIQGLFRLDGQLLAVLVLVMDASGAHHYGHRAEDGKHCSKVSVEACLGKQFAEHCNVGQYESDEQIRKGYQPRLAHFIKGHDGGIGEPVPEEHTGKCSHHPKQKKAAHDKFRHPVARRNTIQMPGDVAHQAE